MKRQIYYTVGSFCLIVAVVGACSFMKGTPNENEGSIVFSHSLHVQQADCSDCHNGIDKNSGTPNGNFIPGKQTCANCHEEEVKKNCQMCHRGASKNVRFMRISRNLNFSHANHGERVKECITCHQKNKFGSAWIPKHETCNSTSCHKKDFETLQCSKCHKNLHRFSQKPDIAIKHTSNFANNHGILARQSITACTQCHDQTFCADCHGRTNVSKPSLLFPEKVDRQFIHRGDFLTRHQIEARAAPQKCRTCHGQKHCRSCHALNGLAETTDSDVPAGEMQNHHPSGWMTPDSNMFHGRKARQDIGRCASCHDKGSQSNCVGCHRVGGLGGNPHPTGWSWRNKDYQCRNSSMCAICHTGGQGCR